MPDLFWLADLGRASLFALWLPVAAWTAVALVAEGALRLGRPPAALALPVRGTVLAALPLAVVVPAVLGAIAPEAAVAVAAVVPDIVWLPEVAVGGSAAVAEAAGPPVLDVLFGLAVLGVAVVGAVGIVRLLHALAAVGWARRSARPSGPAGRAAVDAARQRLGVARPVAAAEAPAGAAPFTVGWRRPIVALPPDLDADAREVAAVHEIAHVRRADFAWHVAQRAVAAVFGAHPLVWALGRGLDLDRERAADAVVLDVCPDKRRAYADLLFSYAALPAPALALGAARGSSSLKTRIDAMTRPLSPDHARRLSRLGRLAALAVLALTVVGTAAMSPARPSPALSPDSASGAPTDSLTRLIDRVDFGPGPDGGDRLTVRLTSEATHDDAVGILDIADAGEAGTRPALVEVRYDGGAVRRAVRLADGTVVLGDFRVSRRSAPRGLVTRRDTTDEVYEVADEQPELIGGLEGIQERLEYPELQRRAGVEGRSVLQFVVETDGTVGELQVIRSSGNDGLDRAALAAVREARFRPGRQDGEPVRVRFALPVTFRLPGDGETGAERAERMAPRGQVRADDPDVRNVVDEMPQLIGGLAGLQERVQYPAMAREAGIEGQVVVQFVVNEEGAVEDAAVLRSPHDMLSEAALQAVRQSRFEPGRDAGEAVRVRFAVPVTFRLPGGDGEDRGQALPSPTDVRQRLPHWGTALNLLENEQQVQTQRALALQVLDDHGAAGGTATVRYTLLPNGRTRDFQMVEDTSDGVLGGMTRFLVAMMQFADNRRPVEPLEGATFSLQYSPQR